MKGSSINRRKFFTILGDGGAALATALGLGVSDKSKIDLKVFEMR